MKKEEDSFKRMSFASPTFGTQFERGRVTHDLSLPEDGTKKSRFKRWFKRTVIGLILAVFILGGVFGWEFYSAAASLTGQHNPIALFQSLLPQHLAETNGRVNILLAGYSVGDPHHGGAQLTDSIMIVSINPKNKTGALISVPRDLWVRIPGNSSAKINAAYEDGQRENFSEQGYFKGGMGLLEKVISQDFGINFNYYALINYAAFKDAVNAVGGIKIDIQSPTPKGIYDAYTHLKLPNGWVTLDGQQALDLARARGDGAAGDVYYGLQGEDFGRTLYQQKMLLALKNKATKVTSLINPLRTIRLVNSVGNNVQTDLNLGQLESLYRDTKGINSGQIQTITLNNYKGQNLLTSYYIEGQDSLIPATGIYDYSQIQNAVQQIIYGS